LNEISKTSDEENWTIRQKMVQLEVEKVAFDKEKQFAREKIERDERRIEELKQMQLLEHENLKKQIQDEKITILEERSKLETMARLGQKQESQISRAEIDAAVKVAEDASKQADTEREKLLEIQRQFEMKKRELVNQESQLRVKENELEMAISAAKMKELNAENAYKNIKRSEQNLAMKYQLFQRQMRELGEREDRLAREKIEMSKERLELQALRKKLYQSRCSLCKIGERSQEISDILTSSEPVADDHKIIEANFLELQRQEASKMDKLFDSDVDVQYKNFKVQNELETNLNLLPNISEMPDSVLDPELLMLKFDVLKGHFSGGENGGF
jgi:Fas-binding factor 1